MVILVIVWISNGEKKRNFRWEVGERKGKVNHYILFYLHALVCVYSVHFIYSFILNFISRWYLIRKSWLYRSVIKVPFHFYFSHFWEETDKELQGLLGAV